MAACSNSANRPDFSVLVCSAYLFKSGGIELVDEIKVDAKTPLAFVVQTRDDKNTTVHVGLWREAWMRASGFLAPSGQ